MMTRINCYYLSLSLTFIFNLAIGQIDPIGKDHLAIGGYDVVAYFVPGNAIKGTARISSNYDGLTYHFVSQENKTAFDKNPEKYLPQFDGYCALAIGAQKKKVSVNPATFKITNGKLYLFYNSSHVLSGNKFNSLEPWIKDEKNLIKKSEANWLALKTVKK